MKYSKILVATLGIVVACVATSTPDTGTSTTSADSHTGPAGTAGGDADAGGGGGGGGGGGAAGDDDDAGGGADDDDDGAVRGDNDDDCDPDCCKVCDESKACGDSCISANNECHQPDGCACEEWEAC